MRLKAILLLLFLFASLAGGWMPCRAQPASDEKATSGEKAMVATVHPLATDAAVEVLESGGRQSGVRFTYAPGTGVRFVKQVETVPGKHVLALTLEIINEAAPDFVGSKQFSFTPAACVPTCSQDSFYVEPAAVAAWGAQVRGGLPRLLRDEVDKAARRAARADKATRRAR